MENCEKNNDKAQYLVFIKNTSIDIVLFCALCYNGVCTRPAGFWKGEGSMISVIKRDKETVGFQLTKLTASIEKALQAAGNVCSQEIAELLSLRTTADFQP